MAKTKSKKRKTANPVATIARKTVGLGARTLDDALAFVVPFVDPVLDWSATGSWDPAEGRWGDAPPNA